MVAEYDVITQRPRTPNDPHSVMTDEQIKNVYQRKSINFKPIPHKVFQDKRMFHDRFTTFTNPDLLRDNPRTTAHGWIDYQWNQFPPVSHNTCRYGASTRWGPEKTGMRTNYHSVGEDSTSFVKIDTYKRPPTNQPGYITMLYGRATPGYYAQRNPNSTTWFCSGVPLNKTDILKNIHSKDRKEYKYLKQVEQHEAKSERWPSYTEYTDRYLLETQQAPKFYTFLEKKLFEKMAGVNT